MVRGRSGQCRAEARRYVPTGTVGRPRAQGLVDPGHQVVDGDFRTLEELRSVQRAGSSELVAAHEAEPRIDLAAHARARVEAVFEQEFGGSGNALLFGEKSFVVFLLDRARPVADRRQALV